MPYMLLAQDDVGNSTFGGGISFVIGYTYIDDKYGAQLIMKFSSGALYFRNKDNGSWSDLVSIIK